MTLAARHSDLINNVVIVGSRASGSDLAVGPQVPEGLRPANQEGQNPVEGLLGLFPEGLADPGS